MKKKEKNSIQNPKKIRNKLIYYTYLELKKKQNKNKENCLLINSMNQNDLNNKYQKCSDYCVEKIETYTHMNGMSNNNNYCHISVTYCSLNNNYHMIVDNLNVAQYIGKNNIVGKYYKGNMIQIGTTSDKYKWKININEKFEKKIIGEQKMMKPRRSILSSLAVTKNIKLINNENNNEIYKEIERLKSNNNEENHKRLIKDKKNNEKLQTNYGFKIRKANTIRNFNKYMSKLKQYCSNLIILERKQCLKNYRKRNTTKETEPSSTSIDKKKKKNEKNHRSQKENPKIDGSQTIKTKNINNTISFTGLFQSNSIPKNIITEQNGPEISKLKSQTKVHHNLFKIQTKNSIKMHTSIDKIEERKNVPCNRKHSVRKINSPKKYSLPKKANSPKKGNNNEIISGNEGATSKFYQRTDKKEKTNDGYNIKKFLSSYKIDYPQYKRKANIHNKNSNINEKNTNSNFRTKNNNITKRGRIKKSLTINKMYKFRACEILEKKKENRY